MAATIKDIAKATGLSQSTISKYINGGNVRPANRKVIDKAIKEYDFHPNEAAQAIRGKSRKLIAIIVPSINVDYCRGVVIYAQQLLRERGYAGVFYECASDAKIEEQILRKIISRRINGIIALPIAPGSDGYKSVVDNNIPLVFLGDVRDGVGANRVMVDDIAAGEQVIDMLCRYGHKRVGVIVGQTEYRIMSTRLEIMKNMFAERGCPIDEDMIFYSTMMSIDVGYIGAKKLLSSPQPPTALVCLNSDLLLGAKVAALELGFRIPEDVSLCGSAMSASADNEILSNITMVKHPIYSLTDETVRVLLDHINDTAANKRKSVYTATKVLSELYVGSSLINLNSAE